MPDETQQPDDLPAPRPALGQEQWLAPQPETPAPPPGMPPAMLRAPEGQPKPKEEPKQDDEPKPHAITGMGPGPQDVPPEKSVPDFVLNHLIPSGVNFVTNTWDAVTHPARTIDDMGALLAGGVKAVARSAGMDLSHNRADDVAQAFANYAKARWFNGPDALREALYNDPVGMASDFSMVANLAGGVTKLASLGSEAGGLERLAQTLQKTSKAARTAGEVTNLAAYPSLLTKAGTSLVSRLVPKEAPPPAPPPEPAFDPRTAEFDGGLPGAFDPKTKTFSPPERFQVVAAPKPDMEALTRDAVKQRAYDLAGQEMGANAVPGRDQWLKAEEYYRNNPLKPPEEPKAPAPQPKPTATPAPTEPPAKTPLGRMLAGFGVAGWAADLLTHHLMGGLGGGILGAAAVRYLPELLRSGAGQQMLARIGPNSTPGQVAAVARDMIPALHTIHQSQQPIIVDPARAQQLPPALQAKGGPINDELARIQRERLRLPGVLQMLENRN